MTSIDIALRSAGLFAGLDEAGRTAVARDMRSTHYAAGQTIFARGDSGRELYLVVSGRVRLSVLTAEGRELSFAHAEAGTVFGEIAMLDGGMRTADATAVDQVEAMVLGQSAFKRLLATQPGFADAAIRFLCQRLREADLQLEGIALHRIEVRLARFLLGLCAQHDPAAAAGESGDRDKAVTIALGMSQGELALLLGASRPKVNGALAILEHQGAIVRTGNTLRCELDELRSIAEAI